SRGFWSEASSWAAAASIRSPFPRGRRSGRERAGTRWWSAPSNARSSVTQASPCPRGEDLRYMQGTVVAWDPETAENIVRIRGTDHTNVPLIDLGIGQRSIQAGDQVAIMSWSPNGGTAAYFVMGRLVVPGTGAAQRSADALSTVASEVTQELLTSP